MSKRTGVMLAKKLTEWNFRQMPEMVIYQPKINGQRCRAKSIDGKIWLFSSQGNVINSMPHINKQLEQILPPDGMQYDGELYNPEIPFQEISGMVRTTNFIPARSKEISFWIFDIINDKDQDYRINLMFAHLYEAFKLAPHLKAVPTIFSYKSELELYYEEYLRRGYEGIIVRDPSAYYQTKRTRALLKKKKLECIKLPIMAYTEAIDKNNVLKGMLGSVGCKMPNNETFWCGAGNLNHSERIDWWQQRWSLLNKTAHIEYPELTKRGVPHQPILKEIL